MRTARISGGAASRGTVPIECEADCHLFADRRQEGKSLLWREEWAGGGGWRTPGASGPRLSPSDGCSHGDVRQFAQGRAAACAVAHCWHAAEGKSGRKVRNRSQVAVLRMVALPSLEGCRPGHPKWRPYVRALAGHPVGHLPRLAADGENQGKGQRRRLASGVVKIRSGCKNGPALEARPKWLGRG